jgi:hypothetical protein
MSGPVRVPAGRIQCCVPFCNRTRRPLSSEDEEWLCNKHFAALPKALRVEYDSAWHQADKADRRAADGIEPPQSIYVRVTQAWEACKAAALASAFDAPATPAEGGGR